MLSSASGTRPLQAFVVTYRFQKGRDHTHTYFGIGGTRKLSVPEAEREEFYDAYRNYVESNGAYVLNGRGFNSITEKSQAVNNMFADIDLKLPLFQNDVLDIDGAVRLIKAIAQTFHDILSEALDETTVPDPITAYRMFYKCHLYFPGVPVSKELAKKICGDVERRLLGDYPWLAEEKVVDASVYTSGLRILGSHKGTMGKNGAQEAADHNAFFGDRVPYNYYYRIGQLQDDGAVQFKDEITLADLKETSIICASNVEPIRPSIRYQPRPQAVRRIAAAPRATVQRFLDLEAPGPSDDQEDNGNDNDNDNDNDLFGEDSELDPETATEESNSPNPDISDAAHKRAINTYLSSAFAELANGSQRVTLQAGIESIKQYDSGVTVVVLPPQSCPFIQREHRRTAERRVSALYVSLSPLECSLKCSKCEGQRIPLRPIQSGPLRDALKRSLDYQLRSSLLEPWHENISEFVFQLLKDEFAATPLVEGGQFVWHFYDTQLHRWVRRERIIGCISNDRGPVKSAYREYLRRMRDERRMEDKELKDLKAKWRKLRELLSTTGFIKGGILPLLARKLDHYWSFEKNATALNDGFMSKLDENPRILGFRNGVWDFDAGTFRVGQPSDFISMSTHLDYVPYDEFPEDIRTGLEGFLKSIFTAEDSLNYTLNEIASCLNGTPAKQRFFIMTGAGANGKSTLVRLLNLALGDYAGEVSVTLFTHPRPSAERATPEIMQIKGKRFVSCSEPNPRDPLNLGTIKWLTGGDRITARALRENNQSFYLQATFVCLTNDVPPINATQDDFGTWRRIKTICYEGRFVENPNPNAPNEKLADPKVNDNIDLWKGAFAALLVKLLMTSNTRLPPPVPAKFTALWQTLQNRNDIFRRFVTEMVTRTDDAFASLRMSWNTFDSWKSNLRISKGTNYDHFLEHMTRLLGSTCEENGVQGWKIEIRPIVLLQNYN